LRTADLTPYYIGKGKDGRAWSKDHSVVRPSDNSRIVLLETQLTELGALALERRMIRWYGRKDISTGILRNKTDGGEGCSGIIPWNKGINTGSFLTEAGRAKVSDANKFPKNHGHKISAATKGVLKSEEHKRKLSETGRGNIPWNKGKTGVQSSTRRGAVHSEEAKSKMSAAHKGIPNTPDQKAKISASLKGRIMSDETKQKMSEARKRIWAEKKAKMKQDDLTTKQLGPDGLSQYAVFLPAISGFYATFIGMQRVKQYVDPARFPKGMTDMEQLNWLDDKKAFFPYKWSLSSGGHASLDLTKPDPKSDMVRKRDPNTVILGDSGGYQIGKGLWPGEWKDPNSAEVAALMAAAVAKGKYKITNAKGKEIEIDAVKEYQNKLDAAQKKRDGVLKWLDGVSNYAMILDIPTWITKDPIASAATGMTSHATTVQASKYNIEYFMKHRKGVTNGGAKFLNVMQGANHPDADDWYETMKEYCDPVKYPDNHLDGWAMGGQNMCDVHLILKRFIALRFDNLLQEGKHDWMHFLGTSRLEWAVLLTVIQRAVRKYVNPAFTISFDCASPFLATANGQVYHEVDLPDRGKWVYRMNASIDDKKYSNDTTKFSTVAMRDAPDRFPRWDESPISDICTIKDICTYKPGDKNKIGKEGKTSWDSFSYALQMGHNVWTHIHAVQEANRKFDLGERPTMMQHQGGDYAKFEDIVERIFAATTREDAMAIIESYSHTYWLEIIGGRGYLGKKAISARPMFASLFETEEEEVEEVPDDEVVFNEDVLDALENEQE
jgi:hypothetical protein